MKKKKMRKKNIEKILKVLFSENKTQKNIISFDGSKK